MSEQDSGPLSIMAQEANARAIAEANELPADAKSILYAMVIHGVKDSDDPFKSLSENAGWTSEEYQAAVFLEERLRVLGAWTLQTRAEIPEVSLPPDNHIEGTDHETPPKEETPESIQRFSKRARITRALENAFSADDGMAEEWLSGTNTSNAARFRNMLRLELGIGRQTGLGKLMVTVGRGGAGLTLEEVQNLGIGLGYNLVQKNDRLIYHDVHGSQITFDGYKAFLGEEAGAKFEVVYFGALRKLVRFGEKHSQT